MQILGIDPSSTSVGWGVLTFAGEYVKSGELKPPRTLPIQAKFRWIHKKIEAVLAGLDDELIVAMETVFAPLGGKSVGGHRAALVLAQARGAILAALDFPQHEVVDLAPSTIKKWVGGHGHSTKDQVRKMVEKTFDLEQLGTDEADALAMALTILWKED